MASFMQEKFLYFCSGQAQISDKLQEMTRIDPAYGGGIDKIELDGIDVVHHPFPRPLVVGGFEEVHHIADGFSLSFADAIIGGDWFVIGCSRENYVRLRIAFSGAARFRNENAALDSGPASARVCSYIIQPAGSRISSSYDGGQEHHFCTISVTSDFLCKQIGIELDELPKVLNQAWEKHSSAFGEFKISDKTRHAAQQLFLIESEGSWRTHEIRTLANSLLCLLFSDWQAIKGAPTTRVSLRPDERAKLYTIMHMIADNPSSVGTLEELSRDWGLNRNKLHLGFKHLFGRSINQFAIKQKIELAKTLLREGNAPIAEVAEEVGFSEPTNFTSSFKMQVGETPCGIASESLPHGAIRTAPDEICHIC